MSGVVICETMIVIGVRGCNLRDNDSERCQGL